MKRKFVYFLAIIAVSYTTACTPESRDLTFWEVYEQTEFSDKENLLLFEYALDDLGCVFSKEDLDNGKVLFSLVCSKEHIGEKYAELERLLRDYVEILKDIGSRKAAPDPLPEAKLKLASEALENVSNKEDVREYMIGHYH